jgi:uncharacterized protein YkwD
MEYDLRPSTQGDSKCILASNAFDEAWTAGMSESAVRAKRQTRRKAGTQSHGPTEVGSRATEKDQETIMLRRVLFILTLLLVLSPSVRPTYAADPAATRLSAQGVRLVELINHQRAKAGLGPVKVNTLLVAEAQRFSGVQAGLGRLSHRGVDGTNAGQRLTRVGYPWRFFGENLAAGQQTPEAVVRGWMNSPTHRAVVLHVKAREIGIGHTYKAADRAGYLNYWVMLVGQTR